MGPRLRWAARKRLSSAWVRGATGRVEPVRVYGHALTRDAVQWYRNLDMFRLHIVSRRELAEPRALVGVNFLDDEFLSFAGPKVFIRAEPMHGMTARTREILTDGVVNDHVFSFAEPDVERRMVYPGLGGRFVGPDRALAVGLETRRPHLACLVNRYVPARPGTLHGARIEVADAFGADIDVYGDSGPDGADAWPHPGYRGRLAHKVSGLRDYTFNVCFENSDEPGYITEKLFDAMRAGCVPLYRGGGGYVAETVPPACYVDCRALAGEEVAARARSMTHDEIVAHRRAGLEFLGSPDAARFTQQHLHTEIARRLEAQGA